MFPPLKAVFAVRQNRWHPHPGQAPTGVNRLRPDWDSPHWPHFVSSWPRHRPRSRRTGRVSSTTTLRARHGRRRRAARGGGGAGRAGSSGLPTKRRTGPSSGAKVFHTRIDGDAEQHDLEQKPHAAFCGAAASRRVKRAICRAMNGSGEAPLDLFVVGGGINGAGIACDAAGRALKVGLCEMNDFAGATSSASTKLIHGGLRYLEHYEFRLVREALMEREVLLAKAPHLIWPLRFVLPHEPHLRPRWMLRLGLFLYDHLDWHMTLPKSQSVDLPHSKFGAGLKPVVQERLRLFRRLGRRCPPGDRQREVGAPDGRPHLRPPSLRVGAAQRRRQAVEHRARRHPTARRVKLQRARPGQCRRPVGEALPRRADRTSRPPKRVRLIKGSHIIVPRLHDGDHAFILQNNDNRIVFVIPYERDVLADRHDRHSGRGRREAGLHAGGDRLSLRDRQPLHGQAGARRRTWCGPIPACARCSTTATTIPRR